MSDYCPELPPVPGVGHLSLLFKQPRKNIFQRERPDDQTTHTPFSQRTSDPKYVTNYVRARREVMLEDRLASTPHIG
jgi:hypothetical protein